MQAFTLPTKSQIHLCLDRGSALALLDLLDLHLLEVGADPEHAADIAALRRQLQCRGAQLTAMASAITSEMRACGWSLTAES